MALDGTSPVLSEVEFATVQEVLYNAVGINFPKGKEELVRTRLLKRLRALGIASFSTYLQVVTEDRSGQEFSKMVDVLTTNKTSFFREEHHFEFMLRELVPHWNQRTKPVRIWSAGCSSGEEPYTLAMVLRSKLSSEKFRSLRILATDLSSVVLKIARAGIYDPEQLTTVPKHLLLKNFASVTDSDSQRYAVSDELRRVIRFGRLNLMAEWPMRGPFDCILCRNVMIYFDDSTRQAVVDRLWKMLPSGGHLFIGHSESLSSLSHQFRYVCPALYVK